MAKAKLAAFDMDGTLIQGRLVFSLAERCGLSDKVRAIQASAQAGYEQSRSIAALFAGLARRDLDSAMQSIPITKNCDRTIAALRERQYKIGIISDSYTAAASALADTLDLDFVAANELEIVGGRITGKVEMPLGWEKIGCFCKISVCKRYHLENFARKLDIPMKNTVAVGDTKSDICMIRRAAVGIAFMPKDSELARATDKVVSEPDLLKVMSHIW